jgi:hypothetical protein
MKNQIKEVQDYFRRKIIAQDYEIESITMYTMRIKIDGEYIFNLWIGNLNSQSNYIKTYSGEYNFMSIEFSEEEKEALYKTLAPIIIKFKQEEFFNIKKAELEKLEREIKSI